MTRGVIAIQTTGRTSALANVTWTDANATDKHEFDNQNEKVLLLISNTGGAGSRVTTIQRKATIDGTALAAITITTPDNCMNVVGPFPAAIYETVAGAIEVDPPTPATGLQYAVVRVGNL